MAHYRIDRGWPTLGTVPKRADPSPVSQQLAAALEAAGETKLGLARKLSKKGSGHAQTQAKRRWIHKILDGSIDAPDMSGIEKALSLPRGHFEIPSQEQIERRRVRLEELEGEIAYLEEWVTRGFAALGVAPELQDEARRVLADGEH